MLKLETFVNTDASVVKTDIEAFIARTDIIVYPGSWRLVYDGTRWLAAIIYADREA